MTSQGQHDRLFHRDAPCLCPPDWPRDLAPGDCLACFLDPATGGTGGCAVPREQCLRHREASRIDAPGQGSRPR